MTFASYVPAGSAGSAPADNQWRVTYVENGEQKHQDFPSDTTALGFAGAVGGTLSRIVTG